MCDENVSNVQQIENIFKDINKKILQRDLITIHELENVCFPIKPVTKITRHNLFRNLSIVICLIALFYEFNVFTSAVNYIFGVRCIFRNNYFIWEATRPLSDCNFCVNVSKVITLQNVTQAEFSKYAYTSKPIVIKQAFAHWPATKVFTLEYFRDIYNRTEDSHRSVDEECQFLHFKSDFISIRDVFEMSRARIGNLPGEKSWYVGWGNCHPVILEEMRKHYPKPHFLPEDAEMPSKDYVFMGYDDGATMHLDFINRLMWQAQLKGSKIWNLLPPPECQNVCGAIKFLAEPGDAVLVDTRVWYHGTTITPGEFSISIQSEYG